METYYLQAKLHSRLAELSQFADTLPGVVIIHDLMGTVIWMCERGLQKLGISLDEVANLSTDEYYNKFFNTEDAKDYVPKILDLLQRNNDEEVCTYFQQVRYGEHADWNWYMSSTKIWMRDEQGQPMFTITVALPVDAMHHMTSKAARLLEENHFLRSNRPKFANLSRREVDVLRLMALGKSSSDTAEELFIALNTVETHRKNIRKKLGASSFYELTQYARAFDLI